MRGDRIRQRVTAARARQALRQLEGADVNFEVTGGGWPPPGTGWRIDDDSVVLPPEAPGAPEPGGSWETARSMVTDYEFADPSVVSAVYDLDHPLVGRTMLLEGRFAWMRFLLGVRVCGVIDEERAVDGRPARVWGWYYRTLEGHLEVGQMNFEVWKWVDTGEVVFRIHAFSQPARIPNLLVRAGFALFGRRVQKKFIRRALERVRAGVEARAGGRPPPPSTATAAGDTGPWLEKSRHPG